MQDNCIFCSIANKDIPVQPVYKDEYVLAFPDINPVAPVHVLVIPKQHVDNLLEVDAADHTIGSKLIAAASVVARKMGLEQDGFRVVINTKEHGGQTVHHLHLHVMGGRHMKWPPG